MYIHLLFVYNHELCVKQKRMKRKRERERQKNKKITVFVLCVVFFFFAVFYVECKHNTKRNSLFKHMCLIMDVCIVINCYKSFFLSSNSIVLKCVVVLLFNYCCYTDVFYRIELATFVWWINVFFSSNDYLDLGVVKQQWMYNVLEHA